MKKIFLLIISVLISIGSIAQTGSASYSGVFERVNDTTTYQSAATTKHSQGYADSYWNNQATRPHFDMWNGASYTHVFDFNAGGSGGGAITDGSATTANGTAVDFGGTQNSDAVVNGAAGTYGTTFDQQKHFTVNVQGGNNAATTVADGGDINLTSNSGYINLTTFGGNGTQIVASGTGYAFSVTGSGILANVNNDATGDFLYRNSSGYLARRGIGSTGNVLTVSGGLPTWATASVAVGGITGLGTGAATALGINVGSTGSFVTNGGALGTPSSGVATNLTGTASGLTAGTVTTNANLSGDVISSGNTTTYNAVVPSTKGGAGTINGILKANGSGVTSVVINSDLPAMTATVGGAVPTPPNNTTTFLRGDGTFAAPSGSGTVNSGTANQIAYYAGTGTAVSGTNAIPNGTTVTTQSAGDNSTKPASTAYVATAVTAAALPAADATHDGYLTQTDWSTFNTSATGVRTAALGGTGLSTYAIGDLIYASATTPTLSKLADVATGNSLISGGVNTAPSWGKITSAHIDATVQTAGLSFLLASGGTASAPVTFTGTSTNIFNYSFASLGTTITDGAGAYYKNPTIAAAGTQQLSPIITLEGNGWKTNATAGSQPVAWQLYNLPVQAAAAPTTSLVFQSRINGADGVGKFTLKSDGAILASESTGLTVRANSLAAGGVSFTGTAPSSNELFVANTGFSLRNSATISTAIAGMTFNMGSFTTTSGNSRFLELLASYAPTSGTGTFSYVTMPSTSVVNESGGANGDVTIFNLTPVITSAGGNLSLLDYNPAVTTITGSHYALRIGAGRSGFGTRTPTALVHMAAGTATASTAPLKFTSGTNLTTPEAGAVEFDGTNYFGTASTTRYTFAKTLTATATLDFGSTTAGNATDLTITVTGAADGDAVSIGVPNGSTLSDGAFTAWVSASNTVTIRFINNNLVTALDPASGTFRASVIKY